jgi:hypothetical protein
MLGVAQDELTGETLGSNGYAKGRLNLSGMRKKGLLKKSMKGSHLSKKTWTRKARKRKKGRKF